MANDLNNCQFIGRLGKDPEVKYLPNGNAVASFSIACGESWKDQQGGKQERTEWVNCSAFGKLAEIIGEYLKKGSQVFIGGKMKTDKYQAQDGSDRYSTKIVVRDMQMLDSKPQGGQQQAPQPQTQGYQQQRQAPQQPQAKNFAPDLGEGWNDDIPFAPIGLQYGKSLIHSM